MHKVLYRAGGIWAALIPVPVIAGAYESNYVLEWMRIPFVEALLAAVIFVSILAEIKTAGFSGGGLIAVIIIRSYDSCYYRYILFGGSFVRK